MPKVLASDMIVKFKNRNQFSREELFEFYQRFEPQLSEATFSWRIYDLKRKNLIKTIRRGHYAIKNQSNYNPELSIELLKLGKVISKNYKDQQYCIWETPWINEFSQHQSPKKIIVIEIEKELVASLFYVLKDAFRYDFYFNLDEKEIVFYLAESKKPVVIKNLVTRAPIVQISYGPKVIPIPTLEKVLVDLFVENTLFAAYQGAELVHIFEKVIQKYAINYSKLLNYAKRRGKAEEIKHFIQNHIHHPEIDFLE